MPGKINSLTNEQQNNFLKNTYGITQIDLYEDIQHICPLGEQVGVTHYDIEVIPGEKLAELVQLHWDIQELMGKVFTLESGSAKVLEILKSHYTDAKKITVVSSCKTNRHMATKVKVEYIG